MNDKQSYRWIDIFKGIGIILIVMGHCGAPLAKYFCYWHVAIFFMISGYTYKTMYTDNLKNITSTVWKKLKRLYLPFLFVGCLYTCMNNVFLRLNILTNNEKIFDIINGNKYGALDKYLSNREVIRRCFFDIVSFRKLPKLAGAGWFVPCLFFAFVIYMVLDAISKQIKSYKVLDIIVVMLFLVGCGLSMHGYVDRTGYRINVILYSVAFIHLGRIIREDMYGTISPYFSMYIGAAVTWIVTNIRRDPFSYVRYAIGGAVFLAFISVSGWLLVWGEVKLLTKKRMSFLAFFP